MLSAFLVGIRSEVQRRVLIEETSRDSAHLRSLVRHTQSICQLHALTCPKAASYGVFSSFRLDLGYLIVDICLSLRGRIVSGHARLVGMIFLIRWL